MDEVQPPRGNARTTMVVTARRFARVPPIQMRARTARWVAGCIAAGSIALMVGQLALAYVDRHHLLPAGLTGGNFPNVFADVVDMAVPVVGFVLASRRPGNRIGWLFLAAGVGLALSGFSGAYGLHALVVAPGSLPAGRAVAWLANWVWMTQLVALAFLLLLFPTGQLRSRRWRPAAWFVGGVFALGGTSVLVVATASWAHPLSHSQSEPVGRLAPGLAALLIFLGAALAVSAAAVVVRFARSAGEERLQLMWFAAAAVLVVATLIPSILTNSVAASVLSNLAFLCLYAAIAIAVLKYRLYEIDRIISRTLAYAIVTGLLVGFYAGIVLLVTEVFKFHSTVAVAAATLAAAALFYPLRQRVQQAVDRRFNRARYDADVTITAFAARLKESVDLDSVRDDLAQVVSRALEPAHLSLWVSRRD